MRPSILLRRRSNATRGYLGFATACAVAFGLLAWLSDGALPSSLGASPVALDMTWDAPRRTALLAFCAVAALALVARRVRPGVAGPMELHRGEAGILTLVVGALAWGGGSLGTLGLLVELAVLTAATGGVFAAMILGHWYLVTPKLPEAPLILLSRALLAVVCVQLVLFVAWVGSGAGPAGGAPFGALTGDLALFVWLRLIVGLVFPLDRLLGGRQDGRDALDGVRDRPPVHQCRHDRGRHDPCRRPVLRLRPARVMESAREG